MTMFDPYDPNDPTLVSWVPVSPGSDFPVQNLPLGIVAPHSIGGSRSVHPRVATRIGDYALDLAALQAAGVFGDIRGLEDDVFDRSVVNDFLALGPDVWSATRARISQLLCDEGDPFVPTVEAALMSIAEVDQLLPVKPGDYVDFYSSLNHALNLGRILRPDSDPLPPNWRHIPIGYHGRSGTVVVSGTPVRRPRGMIPGEDGEARLMPTGALDIELEVGFVVGPGNPDGSPIAPDDADRHVFGVVLLNDWSARDIQAYEYQPLGPFLGKSFATTISPWVVPLEALRPFFVEPPRQEPPPAHYLGASRPWGLDLRLSVDLNGTTIAETNFADMYWTFAQQLAHLTVNGATTAPGDLFASGTVSGSTPGTQGSLMELTWRGRRPLNLPDGTSRSFLMDGDIVTLRGGCEHVGRPRIGLGEAVGSVTGEG